MIITILDIAIPLLLASLGALFTEKAGVLKISIEGEILFSSFLMALGVKLTGNMVLGVFAAILGSCTLSMILIIFHLYFRSNIYLSGLALNLLSISLVPIISSRILGHKGPLIITDQHFTHSLSNSILPIFILIAIISVVFYLLFNNNPQGILVNSSGTNPEMVESRGCSLQRIKIISLLISAICNALAGIYLVLRIEAFVPSMTTGRGWLALVVLYLGFKNFIYLIPGALLLGFLEALANDLQGLWHFPSGYLLGFPYLIALLLLLTPSISNKIKFRSYRQRNRS